MPNFNDDAFLDRYRLLNDAQREAVDMIYGPVMVIAGPGTGKTEVLAMRIANLLRSEAQVQPHEILCLTYTDEATTAMRQRLVQIAGAAAQRVGIYTFHAFCNEVIQSNPDLFGMRSMQPITDLEKAELLYELLDELPSGHALRRLSGHVYFDTGRLIRLFDMMKREAISPDAIAEAADAQIAALPMHEDYRYKKKGKGFDKGDLKQLRIDAATKQLETTKAAAMLLPLFDAKMHDKGRYDFSDMLVWVLRAFREHPALLQSYQERYQHILVDEFQDSNGAQSSLLHMLTDFWDDPNIFVVGDDDQSIYEFQGARIRNIMEFYERYRDTIRVIVLPENYRSTQPILDKAMSVIGNNTGRLITQLSALGLHKNLLSSHPRFGTEIDIAAPVVCTYASLFEEEVAIVMQIERLLQRGVAAGNIAVLYAQHKQAENILSLFERKNIPYYAKRPVNVLTEPLVQNIILMLRYLQSERRQIFSGEALLYELMHAPWFDVPPSDIALLALQMQAGATRKDSWGRWRLLLNNYLLLESAGIRSAAVLHQLGKSLDSWLQQISALPVPLLVEKMMYESGIISHVLSLPDVVWQTQALHTFFAFVRDASMRDRSLKLDSFLSLIDKMQDEKISLPLQRLVHHADAVYCSTAHGAKGSEFEHVFLMGVSKNMWEGKSEGSRGFRLPELLTGDKEDGNSAYSIEVARRLFYVALTRAKKHLHISCALKDNGGKDLEPSRFLDEVASIGERCDATVSSADLIAAMQTAMQPAPEVRIQVLHHQYIDRVLQNMAMSYTNLSKYLRCPLTFYYECVLKVPSQRGDALSFGLAVHDALERMYREMQRQDGVFPSLDEVVRFFEGYLFRERSSFTSAQYERRVEQGRSQLKDYYETYALSFEKVVEVEYKVPRYSLEGIPVTGKIDKIIIHPDGCTIVDYKTGNPDKYAATATARPNDMNPIGGDYWRQMVFYRLLLHHQPDRRWRVSRALFDFIERSPKSGQYKRVEIPVIPGDEEIVRGQLKDSWMRILNHDFDHGCGRSDCKWCSFARRYELIRPGPDAFIEIDDL